MTSAPACFLLALATPMITGCADSSTGTAVHGQTTYRGQPLAHSSLTFFPTGGRPVSVVLDSEGKYSIELPPGDYDVVVNVSVPLPEGFKEGDPLPPPEVVLPAEYTTRARTVLNAMVTEDQQEPINFALE